MSHLSNKLEDRILWADGDIEVSPSSVYDHIPHLDRIIVRSPSNEIIRYNRLSENPIRTSKTEQDVVLDTSWKLPSNILEMDVLEYVVEQHARLSHTEKWSSSEHHERTQRIHWEYRLFESRDMIHIVRALIHIINTLSSTQQVWGTGRGSSVSSYILYVIGVHDVDSFLFELDIQDFIK